MKKLKTKYSGSYYKNGKRIFVFEVSGSKEALAQYKTFKGEYYRETADERKVPLYHSTNWYGADMELQFTTTGKLIVNTDLRDQSFAILEDRAIQGNAVLYDKFATIIATRYMDKIMGAPAHASAAPVFTPSETPVVKMNAETPKSNTPPPPPDDAVKENDPAFKNLTGEKPLVEEKAAENIAP